MADWKPSVSGNMPEWLPWGSSSVSYTIETATPTTPSLEQEITQLLSTLEVLRKDELDLINASIPDGADPADHFVATAKAAEAAGNTAWAARNYASLARHYAYTDEAVSHNIAVALKNLARLKKDKVEAYPINNGIYRIYLHIHGQNHSYTIRARENLVRCLYGLGHYQEALPHLQGTYENHRNHPEYGEQHPDTFRVRMNLGNCLDALCRYQEALPHLQGAYEGYQDHPVHGEQHPSTLTAQMNLGNCLRKLNHYQEALPHLQDAYKGYRVLSEYGEQHPDTLSARMNLGTCLYSLSRYHEALPHLQGACEGYRDHPRYGKQHPGTLTAHINLGICLDGLGCHQDALSHLQYAYDIRLDHPRYGKQHPDTLSARMSLSYCLNGLGRHQDALPHLQGAYEGYRDHPRFGEQHPDTLTACMNLGACLYSLGRHQEALLHLQDAYDNRRDHPRYGEQHPDTLTARMNLGNCLYTLDRHQDALPHLQGAYEGYRDHPGYGEQHPDTLTVCMSMSNCLSGLGRQQDALPYLQGAYVGYLDNSRYGEQHLDTLKVRMTLGTCLYNLGHHQEALPHLQGAYEGYLGHPGYGEQHIDTAKVRMNLGISLDGLCRHQEALPHLQSVYECHQDHPEYGAQHPDTLTARINLGTCLYGLDHHQEALPHLQSAYMGYLDNSRYGEQHLITLTARMALGNCLGNLRHYQQALDHFEAILPFNSTPNHLRGRTHYSAATTLYNWALAEQRFQRYRDAIPHTQQAYAQLIDQGWAEQQIALQSRYMEAKCHLALGQLDKALPLLQQVTEETTEHFGPYHELIMECQSLLLIHFLNHPELGRNPQWLRHLCRGMLESGSAHAAWHEYSVYLVPPLLRWANTDASAVDEVGNLLSRLGHAFNDGLMHQDDEEVRHAWREKRLSFFEQALHGVVIDEEGDEHTYPGAVNYPEWLLPLLSTCYGHKLRDLLLHQRIPKVWESDDDLPRNISTHKASARMQWQQARLRLRQLQSVGCDESSYKQALIGYEQATEKLFESLPEAIRLLHRTARDPLSLFTLNSGEALVWLFSNRQHWFALMVESDQIRCLTLGEADSISERPTVIASLKSRSYRLNYDYDQDVPEPPEEDTAERLQALPPLGETFRTELNATLSSDTRIHLLVSGEAQLLPWRKLLPGKLVLHPHLGSFIQSYKHKASSTTAGQAVRALGCGDYPGMPLLHAVEGDLQLAGELLGASRSKECSEAALRQSSSLLVLSAHGYFCAEYPEESYVAMNPKLTAMDLLADPIDAEVVYLAACVVGLYREDLEGDPTGVVPALLSGNTRCVVAPLTPIDDWSANLFAAQFFLALREQPMPWSPARVRRALERAKRRLRDGEWSEEVLSYLLSARRVAIKAVLRRASQLPRKEAETMICKHVPAGTAHWEMIEMEMMGDHATLLINYSDNREFLNHWANATLENLAPISNRMDRELDPQMTGLSEIIDTMQVWG
ncbi:MAG: tetratricopeptide repeat protein [Sedimenticola sp.]